MLAFAPVFVFYFFILANFRNLQTQKKKKEEEGRIQQRDF